MTTINNAYINALLADATYVNDLDTDSALELGSTKVAQLRAVGRSGLPAQGSIAANNAWYVWSTPERMYA